jgi:hypothetical protein
VNYLNLSAQFDEETTYSYNWMYQSFRATFILQKPSNLLLLACLLEDFYIPSVDKSVVTIKTAVSGGRENELGGHCG